MSESDKPPKKLRSSVKDIFLVGKQCHQIIGSKLPSNRQVLCVLVFNTRTVKLNVRESANLVVAELLIYWKKSRIPTRQVPNCVSQLLKLYDEWEKLHKNCKRCNESQAMKEKAFVEKLDDLFDIAHANALAEIKIPEDKQFLLKQREKGRPGCMLGVDGSLAQKEKRKFNRLEREKKLRDKHLHNVGPPKADSSKSEIEMDVDSDTNISGIPSCEKLYDPSTSKKETRGTVHFITPRLVAALDKCKISDRLAIHIKTAVAQALGHPISDLVINRTTLQRCRKENRSETYKRIKDEFDVSKICFEK